VPTSAIGCGSQRSQLLVWYCSGSTPAVSADWGHSFLIFRLRRSTYNSIVKKQRLPAREREAASPAACLRFCSISLARASSTDNSRSTFRSILQYIGIGFAGLDRSVLSEKSRDEPGSPGSSSCSGSQDGASSRSSAHASVAAIFIRSIVLSSRPAQSRPGHDIDCG